MITRHQLLLLAAGLAGLAAGFGGHRWAAAADDEPEDQPSASSRPPPAANPVPASAAVSPQAARAIEEASRLKSTDSLDELLLLDDLELYGRLGLWLHDAPVEQVEACWEALKTRDDYDMWVNDLVFSRWTMLDPLGAVRSATGTSAEGAAWWAWAINDPEMAIARVMEMAPAKSSFVMRGLAQYHPELAMRMLEDHPEFEPSSAIEGIAKHLARSDPEAAMQFLKDHGQTYQTDPLETWIRDDPHAAFDWVAAQGAGHVGTNYLQKLIGTLERENPEALAELASAQPPGRVRRELESALFRAELDKDPQAALEQARACEAPRTAAERLAEVGRRLAADDPGQAFAIFAEMLEVYPNASSYMLMTRYPNGASGAGGTLRGVSELTQALVASDPRRAMEVAMAADPEPRISAHNRGREGDASSTVARAWAQQDVDGYSGWVDEQPQGPLRDGGASLVATTLVGQQRFAEALEWAQSVDAESSREQALRNTAGSWAHHDPAAAAAWFEGAELSESLRRRLEQAVPSIKKAGQ